MRSYILTASALTALANAQTFTLCNPMEKDCDNNPAIAETFESNFKDGESALKGWQQTAKGAEFTNEGVVFSVKKTGDAPTIQSDGYLHFGFVEVTMKAARGAGIVSSIVLESDDLDEVDWEFIGSDATHAQMNYFGKGNTTVYDRMIMADVPSIEEVHRYALNWTAESLTWLIDDAPVRTLNYGDANGGHNYPQTPCNVRIGIWAGGDSKDKGTQDWAGGKVDYSQAPFNQVVEKVKIINYSPGKEYEWTDKSGSWESIKVIGGKGVESGGSSDSPKPKPSASATGKPEENGAATGKPEEGGAAATSTPCSEEATKSTPPPEETPCDCEVETVTVTGPPPVTETPDVPTPPPEVPVTSESPPPEVPVTSEAPPPPESTTPVESTSCTESTETPGVPTPPPEVPATSDSPPPPESTPEVSTPPPEVPVTSEAPPPPESTTPVESTSCTESTKTPGVPTPPPESSTQPPVTESSEVPPPPPSSTPAESSSSEVPPPPSSSEVPPPPPESTSEVPPESTPCTTSTESVPTAPVTSDSPPPPESTEASSTVPPSPPQATPPTEESSSSVPAESSPCTDSTITVTTTIETPPPVETPKDNCTTLSSVTVPPYPTGGIIVETSPAPSVPYPSNPTGAYPNPPNSTKPPSEEFLGAASTSTVSYLLAIAAGVMVFAL